LQHLYGHIKLRLALCGKSAAPLSKLIFATFVRARAGKGVPISVMSLFSLVAQHVNALSGPQLTAAMVALQVEFDDVLRREDNTFCPNSKFVESDDGEDAEEPSKEELDAASADFAAIEKMI